MRLKHLFLSLIRHVCPYFSMWARAHWVWAGHLEGWPEVDVQSFGATMRGGCELFVVGTGNWTLVFWKKSPFTWWHFFKINFYLISMYTVFFLHVCYTQKEGTRSHYRGLWATMWLMRIELTISGSAASTLNFWAISPALHVDITPWSNFSLKILKLQNSKVDFFFWVRGMVSVFIELWLDWALRRSSCLCLSNAATKGKFCKPC